MDGFSTNRKFGNYILLNETGGNMFKLSRSGSTNPTMNGISKARLSFTVFVVLGGTLLFFSFSPRDIGRFADVGDVKKDEAAKPEKSVCVLRDSSHRCLCFSHDEFYSSTSNNETSLFYNIPLANMKNVKCAMTINAIGRLGNLMGQYATLFALSRLNKRPPFLLPEMQILLNDYFNLSIPVMDYRVATTFIWTGHSLHDWMLPEYNDFTGYFVKLIGYPCSWTFFNHLRDEIRREFQFHEYIQREVNEYLAYLGSNRTFIGMHIRRGDYVRLMQTLYDGVLADSEYLSEAMTYFRTRYKNCLFVVCSDDLDWARANINTTMNDVVFGWFGKAYSPGYDMALLTHCNHTIMTMGTFGFWSAYLTGGETVYLLNFTRPGSKFMKVFHYDTGLLPEWIGIPAKNLYYSTTEASTSTTENKWFNSTLKSATSYTSSNKTLVSSMPTTVMGNMFNTTTISTITSIGMITDRISTHRTTSISSSIAVHTNFTSDTEDISLSRTPTSITDTNNSSGKSISTITNSISDMASITSSAAAAVATTTTTITNDNNITRTKL